MTKKIYKLKYKPGDDLAMNDEDQSLVFVFSFHPPKI